MLAKKTDVIEARLHTSFALFFRLKSRPEGGRALVTIRILHPKMINAETGVTTMVEMWEANEPLNDVTFAY